MDDELIIDIPVEEVEDQDASSPNSGEETTAADIDAGAHGTSVQPSDSVTPGSHVPYDGDMSGGDEPTPTPSPDDPPAQVQQNTVKVRVVIDDFSQESLAAYEASGAIPVAILDDGTERTCQWSEVFDHRVQYNIIEQSIPVEVEALSIAMANNQHFWSRSTDPDQDGAGTGAFVTDEEQTTFLEAIASGIEPTVLRPLHNLLMNAEGILLRAAKKIRAAFTPSGVSFYDGEWDGTGDGSSHVVATFGANGAQIGKNALTNISITDGLMAVNDGSSSLVEIGLENGEIPVSSVLTLSVDMISGNDVVIPLPTPNVTTILPTSGDDAIDMEVHRPGEGGFASYYPIADTSLDTATNTLALLGHAQSLQDSTDSGLLEDIYLSYLVTGVRPYLSLGDRLNGSAIGLYSMTAGEDAVASETSSIAFGTQARSTAKNAFALGKGVIADQDNSLVIGEYNTPLNDEAFVIGNGSSDDSRSNAFVVTPTGEVYAQMKMHLSYEDTNNVMYYAQRSDTGTDIGFGVGVGGINHGAYSNTLGKWLVNGNASDVFLNGKNVSSVAANRVFAAPNGSTGEASFRSLVNDDLPTVSIAKGGTGQTSANAAARALGMAKTAGDSWSMNGYVAVGHLTTSKTEARVSIPLPYRLYSFSGVTVTGTITVRQNGLYLFGSTADQPVNLNTLTVSASGNANGFINVTIKGVTQGNAINNDPVSVVFNTLTFTLG